MTIHSVIFDWKRTLYDPQTKTLIDGSVEVLEYFWKCKVPLYLVGKGKQEMYDEVVRLKVQKYFNKVLFVQDSKQTKDFEKFIDSQGPKNTVVIGDRFSSEMTLGINLGTTTIWIKKGKFKDEAPENQKLKPDYTLGDLKEILDLELLG
jgi:FMN phosphatase YigB (HAD superfamily)